MKIETFQCDKCSKGKKESNHWWTVFILPDSSIVICPLASAEKVEDDLELKPIAILDPTEKTFKRQDLCGRECLQKVVEEWTGSMADKEKKL